MLMEKRVYELLGIKQYKRFVLFCKRCFNAITKTHNNENYLLRGYSKDDLIFLQKQMYKNLKIHLFGIFVGVLVVVVVLTDDTFYISRLVLGILVALLNLYSVMLQRYNLIRISTIMHKQN